jgi:hypothetical protein
MAIDIDLIWGTGEGEYFCKRDWTAQISLIRFNKSGFWRTALASPDEAKRAAPTGHACFIPLTA